MPEKKEEKKSRIALLREKLARKKEVFPVKKEERETVDLAKVEAIVQKMKKKYAERGVEVGEAAKGRLAELRGIIAEARPGAIEVQPPEKLKESPSKLIANIGGIYTGLRGVFTPIGKMFSGLTIVKRLDYYLFSAYMRYSAAQWLAITSVVSVIIGILALVGVISTATMFLRMPLMQSLIFGLMAGFALFLFTAILILLIPKSKANSRATALNIELPFALRHMSTELRAGIGLFKTLQTIAAADYGVLSEEFARTVREIEEGTDTRDALASFAARTQSRPMKSALMHVIRALKTGGNLSEIMNTIASDVSFELRMKMRDFAEKMNFFGVIFIFIAIVMPVFVAILGAIANAPLGEMFAAVLALDIVTITLFYGVLMPFILLVLIFYLKVTQPKV